MYPSRFPSLFRAVFFLGASIACIEYIWITSSIHAGLTQISRLDQVFGLTALFFLYILILNFPLRQLGNRYFSHSVRAFLDLLIPPLCSLIVCFALLHALVAFFGELQGFAGLPFLPTGFLVALFFGLVAFIGITIITAAIQNWVVRPFAPWIHNHTSWLLFGACIFLILHIVLLGVDFSDPTSPFSLIAIGALVLLAALNIPSLSASAQRYIRFLPFRFFFTIFSSLLVVFILGYILFLYDSALNFQLSQTNQSHSHGSTTKHVYTREARIMLQSTGFNPPTMQLTQGTVLYITNLNKSPEKFSLRLDTMHQMKTNTAIAPGDSWEVRPLVVGTWKLQSSASPTAVLLVTYNPNILTYTAPTTHTIDTGVQWWDVVLLSVQKLSQSQPAYHL